MNEYNVGDYWLAWRKTTVDSYGRWLFQIIAVEQEYGIGIMCDWNDRIPIIEHDILKLKNLSIAIFDSNGVSTDNRFDLLKKVED